MAKYHNNLKYYEDKVDKHNITNKELDILKSGFTVEEFNQFVYNNSYKERRNKMIKKENV